MAQAVIVIFLVASGLLVTYMVMPKERAGRVRLTQTSAVGNIASKVANLVDKQPKLREIHQSLTDRLGVVTGNSLRAKERSDSLITISLACSLLMVIASFSYTRIWYMAVINIAVAIVTPAMVINMYVEMAITKAMKQLPEAMEELSAAMFRLNRLDAAIEYSIPRMPKTIAKGFSMLRYDMRKDIKGALDKLAKAYNNIFIDQMVSLLKVYVSSGGNISGQLDLLTDLIREDLNTKGKNKMKLNKYKILGIINLIILPILTNLNSKISPEISDFYSYSVEGNNSLSMAVIVSIGYILVVEIIERV